MKRIIAILLILILALSLAACGKESAKPDAGSTQNGAANNPPAGGNPPAQTDSPTGAAALTLDQFGSKKGDDPEITLFQVSRIFPLTERAWLGLCPVGDYVKLLWRQCTRRDLRWLRERHCTGCWNAGSWYGYPEYLPSR